MKGQDNLNDAWLHLLQIKMKMKVPMKNIMLVTTHSTPLNFPWDQHLDLKERLSVKYKNVINWKTTDKILKQIQKYYKEHFETACGILIEKTTSKVFFAWWTLNLLERKKYLSIATRYEGLKVDLFVTFTMLLLIVYTPKTEEPT